MEVDTAVAVEALAIADVVVLEESLEVPGVGLALRDVVRGDEEGGADLLVAGVGNDHVVGFEGLEDDGDGLGVSVFADGAGVEAGVPNVCTRVSASECWVVAVARPMAMAMVANDAMIFMAI